MAYYRNTHRSEVIASPLLFKLNKVTHEERLTNLCVLLDGLTHCITRLPDNRDALSALTGNKQVVDNEEELILQINDICVTLWLEGKVKQWYIGYSKEIADDGTFVVDHIHRVKKDSNLSWKFPSHPDICNVDVEQVLKIVEDWD